MKIREHLPPLVPRCTIFGARVRNSKRSRKGYACRSRLANWHEGHGHQVGPYGQREDHRLCHPRDCYFYGRRSSPNLTVSPSDPTTLLECYSYPETREQEALSPPPFPEYPEDTITWQMLTWDNKVGCQLEHGANITSGFPSKCAENLSCFDQALTP